MTTIAMRGRSRRMGRTALILGAGVLLTFISVTAGESEPKPKGPPIQRLLWLAPHRIDWRMSQTPMWFSVGHLNRVLCCIPNGVRKADGKVAPARDGSGNIQAVDFEVHEVTAFDPATGLPAATRLLAKQTVRADDPEALKRKRWEFKTESNWNWELSYLPEKTRQTLFRMFLHEDPLFWQTLMAHTEADLDPAPSGPAVQAGARQCFKELWTHIIVFELLHDPSLPLTSKYIEPDDPPSTWWIERQKVKAPWALNRAKLEPVRGGLAFGADGAMRFLPLSDRAREAETQGTELENRESKLPEIGGKTEEAGDLGADGAFSIP